MEHFPIVTEQTLWDSYNSGILISGTKPLVKFTQDEKDAFYRLKFRSLSQKISASLSPIGSKIDENLSSKDSLNSRLMSLDEKIETLKSRAEKFS